ncbi:hypothetical protein N658DRAFT_10384 [Parathielavia hyrcaniae]|uniref:Uncharacterized protein n=1 Tax=Parathielavia hyrcaniae TaxID=113614 RepID=A0AAN6Q9L9_9PEZI|nr:hypothetical protein N658DRAFT_10384 [Parathielavia hyrcaniae]
MGGEEEEVTDGERYDEEEEGEMEKEGEEEEEAAVVVVVLVTAAVEGKRRSTASARRVERGRMGVVAAGSRFFLLLGWYPIPELPKIEIHQEREVDWEEGAIIGPLLCSSLFPPLSCLGRGKGGAKCRNRWQWLSVWARRTCLGRSHDPIQGIDVNCFRVYILMSTVRRTGPDGKTERLEQDKWSSQAQSMGSMSTQSTLSEDGRTFYRASQIPLLKGRESGQCWADANQGYIQTKALREWPGQVSKQPQLKGEEQGQTADYRQVSR